MQNVGIQSIPQWVAVSGWWFPVSVDVDCPHCARSVNVRVGDPHYDAARRTMSGSGTCPGCAGLIHFWIVEPSPANDAHHKTCRGLLMYPPLRATRVPVVGSELVPPKINTAYRQALSVYNAGLWNVTASCCRQTLEAIARALLPAYEIQDDLAQNIKRIAHSVELRRPIMDLAFAIRDGGKLSPHFELASEPDREVATLMLDLTEYMLQYLCALPRLTDEMKKHVEHLPGESRHSRKAG